jgi:TetR/AcrR family transcriptional regulator
VKPIDKRKKGRDAEATKEALLRSATELFALHGFEGVSVETIARQAGVNKALISYHFGGKERLYNEILKTTLEEAKRHMDELRASDRPADEVLREFIARFHEMATVRRPYFPALLLRDVLAGGRRFDEEIRPRIFGFFTGVAEILDRGVKSGCFRPVHPLLAHLGIMGSLIFFYATEPRRKQIMAELQLPMVHPTPEDFLRHIQEAILFGITARPERRAGESDDKEK